MQVSSHMVHFGGKADSVIFTNKACMLIADASSAGNRMYCCAKLPELFITI